MTRIALTVAAAYIAHANGFFFVGPVFGIVGMALGAWRVWHLDSGCDVRWRLQVSQR